MKQFNEALSVDCDAKVKKKEKTRCSKSTNSCIPIAIAVVLNFILKTVHENMDSACILRQTLYS